MIRRLAALASLAASGALSQAAPPAAPAGSHADVLHGVTVSDPYRALEDVRDPNTLAWLRGQGRHAAEVLAGLPEREALQARVAELGQSTGDIVREITRMPDERIYYLRRKAGESQFKLVMRVGFDGPERVLVDPELLAKATGVPHAINYYAPSWDGRRLAYGVSAGGSEDAALHLLDLRTGQALHAPIPRVSEPYVRWAPDSRHLTYNQFQSLPPGAPDAEKFMDSTVFVLDTARRGALPRPLFGPRVNRELGLDRLDVGSVLFAPGSRYMLARTSDTTVPEGKLFVAPLSALAGRQVAWRQISRFEDKITDVALAGNTLYLRTYADAPRGRVIALDLADPDLKRARTVVPEPTTGVLLEFSVGRDAIHAEVREGFNVRLRRHAPGGPSQGVDVAPALRGSAFLVPDAAHAFDDVLFSTSTWTQPSRVMLARPGGAVRDTGLRRNRMPQGVPELEVTEVTVPSHDGAAVPLAILHKKGLPRNGANPTLLVGYGAYGFSFDARFDASRFAWIEKGGVIAFANVRGSGVHGDAWYRAGFKATKPNTWKDGIACARWLVAQGYASPKTLGIWGTSAGGIFAGRAVTAAPDLFAAAIFDVGVMDAVRAELSANGATNTSEFGTAKDPQEFKALLEMSPYHHIRDGVAYPGVMLVHGLNDPRVDVWHSAKAAARLQAASSSGKPVILRLDEQAGHGMGSTAKQSFGQLADIYAFLRWQFGMGEGTPKP